MGTFFIKNCKKIIHAAKSFTGLNSINKQKLTEENSILLVIDMQERIISRIPNRNNIAWNTKRLIDTFNILNLPVSYTEQNPDRLGFTMDSIRNTITSTAVKKMAFSCTSCRSLMSKLSSLNIRNVLISGIESHVCVQQTAIDLINKGFSVFIAIDAIGSRSALDQETAIRRMESHGAIITSTEAAIFEMCGSADRKEFKEILDIIKEELRE